jgi:ketosteroid isomerase-like protein
MAQEDIGVIERLYLAMDERDADTFRKLTHPELEWVPDQRIGEGAVQGRDNVLAWFRDRAEMFEDMRTEVEQLRETTGGVLAFIRVTGMGSRSGAGFDIRIAHLWTIAEGVVVRGAGYGDRGEALKTAGLSDQH